MNINIVESLTFKAKLKSDCSLLSIYKITERNSTIDGFIQGNKVSDDLWKYLKNKRLNGLVIYNNERLFLSDDVIDLGDNIATAEKFSDAIKEIAGKKNKESNHLKYHLQGVNTFFYIESLDDAIERGVCLTYRVLTGDVDPMIVPKNRYTYIPKQKAEKLFKVSIQSLFKGMLLICLAHAYFLRRTRVGAVGLFGVAGFGGLLMLSRLRKGPRQLVGYCKSLREDTFDFQSSAIGRGLKVIDKKFGSKMSLATTFGAVSLTQLVVAHYAVKPLARRTIPILSGSTCYVLQHLDKWPVAVKIGALIALSTLFTYVHRHKRSKYELV